MAQTLGTTFHGQIIAGTFTSREDAEDAIEAFRDSGVFPSDIQVLPMQSDPVGNDVYAKILTERGFSQPQAFYYDQLIHKGKTLVAIHGVTEPGPIIDIFNKFDAGFNPDGSRNVRDDVIGLTTGAVTGAVAGGVAGAVSGGPVGGVLGAAAGETVGGIIGATVGKSAEHKK